jgi:hypothetical protein
MQQGVTTWILLKYCWIMVLLLVDWTLPKEQQSMPQLRMETSPWQIFF